MSSINYLICQKCKNDIPLITLFFDSEGLKIQYKCKCSKEFNIISAEEFIKVMNDKNNLIKGNCQKNKNHKNYLGQTYCYICKQVLCSECSNIHFNEYNKIHETISNEINKVFNNKNNKNENKKIDKTFFEQIEIMKEFIEINNKKYYEEIIMQYK